jgi:hypothetical protein
MTDHPLMRLMKKYDIPLTRENYLNLAYMGEVPEQLSAEQDADLPVELRSSASMLVHEPGSSGCGSSLRVQELPA